MPLLPSEQRKEQQGTALLPKALKPMSQVTHIVQRVAAFLQKRNAAYCESCLVERLLIASRVAMKAAIETDRFSTRIGICPDCRTRKQVIGCRDGAGSSKAA